VLGSVLYGGHADFAAGALRHVGNYGVEGAVVAVGGGVELSGGGGGLL